MLTQAFCITSNCSSTTRPAISITRAWTLVNLSLLLSGAALFTAPVSAQTFADVPTDYWAYSYVEILYDEGITSGCGGGDYCPENPVTRAQMAVFLERSMHGSSYQPQTATGNVFLDVAADDFAAGFIEQLYAEGITGGCGGNNYCPEQQITRAQMAVFLLRSIHGAGYIPSAATGLFADVDLSHWAAAWIEQLSAEGITAGCSNENYCPEDNVSRAQMAVFLVRAFDLDASGVIVTPAGGTVVATANDGTVFTLTLPPNALLTDEEITITPASNVAGLPPGWASLVGLQLEPDGLQLQIPATLVIELPSPAAADGLLLGFTVRDNGEAFELMSAEVNSNTVTLDLQHFSTAGALEVTDQQVVDFVVSRYQDFVQDLSTINSCTGPVFQSVAAQVAELGKIADELAVYEASHILTLDPTTCSPYSCSDIFEIEMAAREAFQDKVQSTFQNADTQCHVAGVPQEVVALRCIAFAQRNDRLFNDGDFDQTLMDLKSCGISTLEISPDPEYLEVGESKSLQAIARDKAGNVLEGRTVVWESLDESIVTVEGNDSSAIITGQQDGKAWVRATDQTSADTGVAITNFNIYESFVTVGWSVEIDPDKKRLQPGERVHLTAILRDEDGTDITSNPFAWSSSDSDVATLDDTSGFDVWVTAVGEGVARITATDVPSEIEGEAKIISGDIGNLVAGGYWHSCAVGDGTVWCWGSNSSGQLGLGNYEDAYEAEAVIGITTAIAVAAHNRHTCAVLEEGSVFCWGDNQYGQLGDGSTVGSNTPVQVTGINSAISVAAGWQHNCAVLADGRVNCWGTNSAGQLGNGSTSNSYVPVEVTGISTAIRLIAGNAHSCALLEGGTVTCWGANTAGQLGYSTTDDSTTPVAVGGISTAIGVSVGGSRTCVILEAGNVWCSVSNWRWLDAGISGVTSYTMGQSHDCATLVDGTVWCAGWNQVGQLGIGTIDGPEYAEECKILFIPQPCSTSPVKVDGINNALVVWAGQYHACALLENGTGWCWGINTYGQLGEGTNDGPELCPLYNDIRQTVFPCSTVPVQVQ